MQYPTKPAFTLDDLLRGPIYPGKSLVPNASVTISTVPATGKKVFYAIKRSGSYVEVAPDKTFSNMRKLNPPANDIFGAATRFNTVEAALKAISDRGAGLVSPSSGALQLVRVEETAGTEQRVVLAETQEAPKGAVVKYAVQADTGAYAADLRLPMFRDGRWTRVGELNTAKLSDSLKGAVTEIANNSHIGQDNLTIIRVAVSAATPTLTETVLS